MQRVLSRKRAEPGDVVGMQMGVNRLDKLEVEFPYELEIAAHLFQHRVNDESFAAEPARDKIAVGP